MSERPVAMVTGGAQRVGLAVCAALARAGCDVIVTSRSGAAPGAVRMVREAGGICTVEAVELSDLAAVEALGARLARDLRRLDVLVHNAAEYEPDRGQEPKGTPLWRAVPPGMPPGEASEEAGAEVDAAQAERLMRVNALAPLVLSMALSPRLGESSLAGGGAIVALADIHAMGRPRRNFCAYQMSKAALVEMVRSLARDLAPAVRVNGVAPGVVAWPERGAEADRAFQESYIARVPLGRAGTPEDAAEVVRWLALDAAYVTGEIVRVDGGRWLA